MAGSWFRDLAWRFRPAATRAVQRRAVAGLWFAVGTGLGTLGAWWCLAAGWPLSPGLVVLGLVAGGIKGRFVLSRSAERTARRIAAREDGSCLGGALSWPTWLLVVLMMTAGIALRHSAIPRPVLGPLYLAVGVALVLGAWRLVRWPIAVD